MGVVKTHTLFSKNSAQYLADLKAISNNEYSKSAFINPTTVKRKDIECIRVDGGYDEGPLHLETQYWWTLHHLNFGSHALLVLSRNSGARIAWSCKMGVSPLHAQIYLFRPRYTGLTQEKLR